MKNVDWEGTVSAFVNIIWFGAWLYIIFGLHNSGWWILVPIIFHWTPRREGERDVDET